ncbi:MAG: hypothetical protein NTU57_01475 [Candidatus Aenigmarchaeota archaeon]|nr:hypothetical protein [Candidatus Aenigmarchaeota archaeon]
MDIKMDLPGVDSFHEINIMTEGKDIIVKSSEFGRTNFHKRAMINHIGKEFGVDSVSCFSVKIPDRKFTFESLKDAIDKVRNAYMKYSKAVDKTDILTIRLPSNTKDELIRMSHDYKIPISSIIESLVNNYGRDFSSFDAHPKPEKEMISHVDGERFNTKFSKITNLKAGHAKLGEAARILEENFDGVVLASQKFSSKEYHDLVAFFEKPKVNIYVNVVRAVEPNVSMVGEVTDNWKDIKEKSHKYGIKSWEHRKSVCLYVPLKNYKDVADGVKKLIDFAEKEKIEWGWWHRNA